MKKKQAEELSDKVSDCYPSGGQDIDITKEIRDVSYLSHGIVWRCLKDKNGKSRECCPKNCCDIQLCNQTRIGGPLEKYMSESEQAEPPPPSDNIAFDTICTSKKFPVGTDRLLGKEAQLLNSRPVDDKRYHFCGRPKLTGLYQEVEHGLVFGGSTTGVRVEPNEGHSIWVDLRAELDGYTFELHCSFDGEISHTYHYKVNTERLLSLVSSQFQEQCDKEIRQFGYHKIQLTVRGWPMTDLDGNFISIPELVYKKNELALNGNFVPFTVSISGLSLDRYDQIE